MSLSRGRFPADAGRAGSARWSSASPCRRLTTTRVHEPPSCTSFFTEPPDEVAFLRTSMNITVTGDCRETMRAWATAGVRAQMCVTSPPYFGLRSYMPNAVKLRSDLSPEMVDGIIKELACLGINPIHITD